MFSSAQHLHDWFLGHELVVSTSPHETRVNRSAPTRAPLHWRATTRGNVHGHPRRRSRCWQSPDAPFPRPGRQWRGSRQVSLGGAAKGVASTGLWAISPRSFRSRRKRERLRLRAPAYVCVELLENAPKVELVMGLRSHRPVGQSVMAAGDRGRLEWSKSSVKSRGVGWGGFHVGRSNRAHNLRLAACRRPPPTLLCDDNSRYRVSGRDRVR
jgi:hypothetical protein